jgi:hypothetical protein
MIRRKLKFQESNQVLIVLRSEGRTKFLISQLSSGCFIVIFISVFLKVGINECAVPSNILSSSVAHLPNDLSPLTYNRKIYLLAFRYIQMITVIASDVSDYVNLLVRIAHIICNDPSSC